MHIFRHADDVTPDYHHNVVMLGNFDGVHRGHQHIIREAKKQAETLNVPLMALTFEPHPVAFFQPDAAPFRITNFTQKMERLEALGVDACLCMAFNADTAAITATAFIEDILCGALNTQHVVVGYDTIFGHKRAGNAAMLQAHSNKGAFGFSQITHALLHEGEAISSSAIRAYIRSGEIEKAEALLGHHVVITGHVQEGQKLARELGYPTANIALHDYVRPKFGVYAAEFLHEGVWHKAVANIGVKPTVQQESAPLLEVHVLGQQNLALYNTHAHVRLLNFLRPEQRFDSLEALKAQIEIDIKTAF